MSKQESISKIEELKQWEALMEEAKNEAEALRDAIKAEMYEQDTEELVAGTYIVRWTSVLSNRFDTTAFKKSCRMCTKLIPNRSKAAASPSHRKSPLPVHRPKRQAKSSTPNQKGGQDYYSLSLPKFQGGHYETDDQL